VLLIVGLAVAAAFLFALAASLQQHEANKANMANRYVRHQGDQATPPRSNDGASGRRRSALLRDLARTLPRSRLWLLGWAINLVGFLVQGAALYLGSVALVQPLLVTQLIFALPLTTWWQRRWPSRHAWLAGAAVCGGVALFLIAHGSPLRGDPDRRRIILACVSAAVAVAVLVRLSAKRPPLVQAAMLSVGAGLCFAVSAVLMKLTANDLVERGVAATAADWPGYTLAASALTGVVLGQWAFATGSLPTAVATMTITNPVASYLIGMLAFPTPQLGPSRLAATVLAGALIVAGVVALSRSSIVQPRAAPAGGGPT
jgi:drug/metabolite transporter (DMT)-like permease